MLDRTIQAVREKADLMRQRVQQRKPPGLHLSRNLLQAVDTLVQQVAANQQTVSDAKDTLSHYNQLVGDYNAMVAALERCGLRLYSDGKTIFYQWQGQQPVGQRPPPKEGGLRATGSRR